MGQEMETRWEMALVRVTGAKMFVCLRNDCFWLIVPGLDKEIIEYLTYMRWSIGWALVESKEKEEHYITLNWILEGN